MQTLEWLRELSPNLSLGVAPREGKPSLLFAGGNLGLLVPTISGGRRRRLCTITDKKDDGLQAVLRSENTWGFPGVFSPSVGVGTRLACTAVLGEQVIINNDTRTGFIH